MRVNDIPYMNLSGTDCKYTEVFYCGWNRNTSLSVKMDLVFCRYLAGCSSCH